MDSLVRWIAFLLLLLAVEASGQTPAPDFPNRPMMDLPVETQKWYLNRSGDCVQDSLGLVGAYHCDFNVASLVHDSPYGPAEMGGSTPSRVASYARKRGIALYNVTGRTAQDTLPWIEWSAKTGRFAAIGYWSRHFQTLYGRDYQRDLFYVQNNWSGTFGNAYEHSKSRFIKDHEASGPWVVVLKSPPPAPNPILVQWWKR